MEITMDNNKGRILVAEDDTDIGAVLSLALRLEGYEVQLVRSIDEAHKLLDRNAVDLMILDWMLTDGTAEEICAAARAKDPGIPIIVISAVLNHETKSTIQCRPVHFMTKPFRIQVLLNTVALLIKQRATKASV
jgi:DNA-binding response OmpR family regulator